MNNSYMDYTKPSESGQIAFIRGYSLEENPCSERTNANARLLWDQGWKKQSKIKCRGVELIPRRDWSGCTQLHGDCPECGK